MKGEVFIYHTLQEIAALLEEILKVLKELKEVIENGR